MVVLSLEVISHTSVVYCSLNSLGVQPYFFLNNFAKYERLLNPSISEISDVE